MSRTRKALAVCAVTAGVLAAGAAPALASDVSSQGRHVSSGPSATSEDNRHSSSLTWASEGDSRHGSVALLGTDNRHSS